MIQRRSEREKRLVAFTIDADGTGFGDRIEGLSGMLGWSALRVDDDPPADDSRD